MKIIYIFLLFIFLTISVKVIKQTYFFGLKSFFPLVQLKSATDKEIDSALKLGVTRRSELYQIFGPSDSEYEKIEFTSRPEKGTRSEKMSLYRQIIWKSWQGHFYIISMSSQTKVLTIYLDENDTVVDYAFDIQY